MKAVLDVIRDHETDCDFKEFLCPCQGKEVQCNWYEGERSLVQHLLGFHRENVVLKDVLEGELPKKDQSWIVIAYDKVLNIYQIFINNDSLLRYLGKKCTQFRFDKYFFLITLLNFGILQIFT